MSDFLGKFEDRLRQREPRYDQLETVEKMVIAANEIRALVTNNVLGPMGPLGKPAVRVLYSATNELAWRVHDKTGLYDKINPHTLAFLEDLRAFKADYALDDNASVLYAGSGFDTSVRIVFPDTLHLDAKKPRKMPSGYNFVQTPVQNIPLGDSSVDLVVFRHMEVTQFKDPRVAEEVKRVLTPEGKVALMGLRRAVFNALDHGMERVQVYPNELSIYQKQ